MAKYIPLDALVAEIERRRSKNAKNKLNLAASFEDNYLLSFLDTLEVKDVDLEKEIDLDTVIDAYMDKNFGEPWDGARPVGSFELAIMAEHFFELGLKAQKGELYMIWFTLLYIMMVITLGGLFWIIKESSKPLKGELYDRQREIS